MADAERIAALEARCAELEAACRLFANVLRHLPPGEVESIVLARVAEGFPLEGVNLPSGASRRR